MNKFLCALLLCLSFVLPAWAADTYTVELSTWERIRIKSLVPQKGSLESIIVALDLIEKVEFSQDELLEYEIETEDNIISWSPEKTKPVVYVFTYLEIRMMRDKIDKMSNKKILPLSKKFIEMCKKIREANADEAGEKDE